MIVNRPQYLDDINYYSKIPSGFDIDIDFTKLPSVFNLDLYQLNGLQPLTTSMFNYIREPDINGEKQIATVSENPSEKEIEYYKVNGITEWQLINVVISLYDFRKNGNTLIGKPYSVSLVPASKRGKIHHLHIDFIKQINIESTLGGGWIYSEFNPFKGWYSGLFGKYALLAGNSGISGFTDSIGFVWEQYILSTKFNKKEIQILEDQTAPKNINSKFKKYRTKLYFEKFTDIKPRKIWGCESPIELFLLQGLAKNNLYPEIQTLIFKDGAVYSNYHLMIENHLWKTEDKLISNVDFFFPEKQLAIFCDGKAFHDSEEKRAKDTKIDSSLSSLGISSLRFSGKQITGDLESVIKTVKEKINSR